MKHCKKLTLLLIAALLLAAALMTGCTGLTPAQDAPADTKKEGIYVRLERRLSEQRQLYKGVRKRRRHAAEVR